MRFSEYLRKLDEGNLGHELERQEAAKKKKPNLKVGENMQKVADMTMSDDEQNADIKAKKEWRAKLRPPGKPLTDWQIPSLKEAYTPPEGWRERTPAEVANSNKVNADMDRMEKGKEQMKYSEKKRQKELDKRSALIKKEEAAAAEKKPLTDWQIPSLKEDNRQYDPNVTRENEEDEPEENSKDDGHAPKPKNTLTVAQLAARKTVKKESLEIPMRDSLGRLSIYSMTESSTPKPLRKALKKAKMGKKLSNKESGNVMNNPQADGSTRTNAAENYKNPQDDIDANDAAEGERRSGGEGTPRQSHLDK